MSEKRGAALFESVTAVSETDIKESASARDGVCSLLCTSVGGDACDGDTEPVGV